MSWITGRHAIEAALNHHIRGRLVVVRAAPGLEELVHRARSKGIAVEYRDSRWLRRTVGEDVRVCALESSDANYPAVRLKEWLQSTGEAQSLLVLLLDHIQDPHNFGAILRSADLFEVDLVISPSKRSVGHSDTVMRTSVGAASYVPVAVETNLNRSIDLLKSNGFWVFASDMSGKSIRTQAFAERSAFVVGAEGTGVSRHTEEKCDDIVAIPTGGHLESLNVSVATAILLYEFRRHYPISGLKSIHR
jgi:23S rRNA (guanosine2251-2'-O)-methyltransferase